MNFLQEIFTQLEAAPDTTILQELRDGRIVLITGSELLEQVRKAQSFLAAQRLKKGDRCALLAHNGIRWVAMDLAIMAEGLIVVPLYARQAAEELVAMMKDCAPALICCGDAALRDGIAENWSEAPPEFVFDQIFDRPGGSAATVELADSDAVTIIYTSGTSGEAKGVVLCAGNIAHMLSCTSGRLDLLMENKNRAGQDRVFHYLPFCFAGSWIMLLTCLLRSSLLTLNTDLGRLAKDMRAANARGEWVARQRAVLLSFRAFSWPGDPATEARGRTRANRDQRFSRRFSVASCAVCGRGRMTGNNVSHANNVTRRVWNVNLQRVRAKVNGTVRRILACTQCIRSGKVLKAA